MKEEDELMEAKGGELARSEDKLKEQSMSIEELEVQIIWSKDLSKEADEELDQLQKRLEVAVGSVEKISGDLISQISVLEQERDKEQTRLDILLEILNNKY